MVLVDKDQEKLAVISEQFINKFGIYVKTLVKNLSISTSPESIFKDLQEAAIRIDILANNGGLGTYGVFTNTDLTTELKMLQFNIVTLTHLTRLFLKDMICQDYGKI
jgi:short-subunit dehydrogenase